MPVPASRPEGHRTLLTLIVTAAAGVLLGLVLVFPSAGVRTRTGDGVRLRLYGEVLPAGNEAADVAISRAERHLVGWFNLELPDGAKKEFAHPELGITLDRARLRRLIRDTSSIGGGVAVADARGGTDDPVDLVVPVLLDRRRTLSVLLTLKEVLDQPALDARLDLDSRAVIPEREGRRLDVDGSLLAIEAALERGGAGAPLAFHLEPPQRRARELADVRHDVLLGYYEAPFEPSQRADDHRFNLALAASKLDGYVLMPGALFDFNATIGPRDEARGYRVAAMAAADELVDGSGSSTSQIAGTLHAAALFAGLDVVERHPPARPGAVELGLDAAVAYPTSNLRLTNAHDFPVVLRATATEGRVRAEVRGPERPHTISVVIQLDGVTPFDVIESADTALERGFRVVAQRGVPGIDLHRYRIRRDGAHAVREVSREHYPSIPQLIVVGARSPSSFEEGARMNTPASFHASTAGRPPRAATTREFIASELVVITQSSDPSRPLLQQRMGGRFAVPNWSKDIGAPAWNLPLRTPENAPLRP